MSQSVNKFNQLGRYSSTSNDENNHSINNGIALSLQSFVDDIPFEFNPKYRTIIVVSFNRNIFDLIKMIFLFSQMLIFLSMIRRRFVIFFLDQ
jgi:hypothetical protein